MTDYPGALHAFIDASGKAGAPLSSEHVAAHVELAAELAAVQAELGVDPSGAFATVKARLDARTFEPVVFRVWGGDFYNGITTQTLNGGSFQAIAMDTVDENVGGGSWDGSLYTVPATGRYLGVARIRIGANAAARSVYGAIGTANADVSHGIWRHMGGVIRDVMLVVRVSTFTQGDKVRLVLFNDSSTFPLIGAGMDLVRIG